MTRVAVPRMGIGESSATTVALVIHELATNSLKYGALSVETGMLDISGSASATDISIVWTERGGPRVERQAEGFGSKLLQRSVTLQLGGSITTDWSPEGVVVTLIMDAEKLSA
jgi:two-component sensor histidine kinase